MKWNKETEQVLESIGIYNDGPKDKDLNEVGSIINLHRLSHW